MLHTRKHNRYERSNQTGANGIVTQERLSSDHNSMQAVHLHARVFKQPQHCALGDAKDMQEPIKSGWFLAVSIGLLFLDSRWDEKFKTSRLNVSLDLHRMNLWATHVPMVIYRY